MFAKYDANVAPTAKGLDSLVSSGLCAPLVADEERAKALVASKLDPEIYRVTDHTAGVDGGWVLVEAKWDGQPVSGDPSAEITKKVAPMACRFQGYVEGMFTWVVQAAAADAAPKSPAAGKPA